jgi:hypothetical protein
VVSVVGRGVGGFVGGNGLSVGVVVVGQGVGFDVVGNGVESGVGSDVGLGLGICVSSNGGASKRDGYMVGVSTGWTSAGFGALPVGADDGFCVRGLKLRPESEGLVLRLGTELMLGRSLKPPVGIRLGEILGFVEGIALMLGVALGPADGPELKLGDKLGVALPEGTFVEEVTFRDSDES